MWVTITFTHMPGVETLGHLCVRVWCVNKWFLLLCRVVRWRRGLWQSVTSTLIALPVWQWRTHTAVGVFLTAGEFHLVIPALDCNFQFILGVFLSVCPLSYSSSCLLCFSPRSSRCGMRSDCRLGSVEGHWLWSFDEQQQCLRVGSLSQYNASLGEQKQV